MSDLEPKDLTLQLILLAMAEAYRVSFALKMIAELGIADLLKDSAKTCEELSQATATHESSLYRLLRAMASKGIFRENHLGCFENTPYLKHFVQMHRFLSEIIIETIMTQGNKPEPS